MTGKKETNEYSLESLKDKKSIPRPFMMRRYRVPFGLFTVLVMFCDFLYFYFVFLIDEKTDGFVLYGNIIIHFILINVYLAVLVLLGIFTKIIKKKPTKTIEVMALVCTIAFGFALMNRWIY